MSDNYEKINIVLVVLGIIGSFLGFIFTTLFNRSIKNRQEKDNEIEKNIRALWKRNDERVDDIVRIKEQLDVLQGEHNVLSCKKNSKNKE